MDEKKLNGCQFLVKHVSFVKTQTLSQTSVNGTLQRYQSESVHGCFCYLHCSYTGEVGCTHAWTVSSGQTAHKIKYGWIVLLRFPAIRMQDSPKTPLVRNDRNMTIIAFDVRRTQPITLGLVKGYLLCIDFCHTSAFSAQSRIIYFVLHITGRCTFVHGKPILLYIRINQFYSQN